MPLGFLVLALLGVGRKVRTAFRWMLSTRSRRDILTVAMAALTLASLVLVVSSLSDLTGHSAPLTVVDATIDDCQPRTAPLQGSRRSAINRDYKCTVSYTYGSSDYRSIQVEGLFRSLPVATTKVVLRDGDPARPAVYDPFDWFDMAFEIALLIPVAIGDVALFKARRRLRDQPQSPTFLRAKATLASAAAIACIGATGLLLVSLPDDLRHYREASAVHARSIGLSGKVTSVEVHGGGTTYPDPSTYLAVEYSTEHGTRVSDVVFPGQLGVEVGDTVDLLVTPDQKHVVLAAAPDPAGVYSDRVSYGTVAALVLAGAIFFPFTARYEWTAWRTRRRQLSGLPDQDLGSLISGSDGR